MAKDTKGPGNASPGGGPRAKEVALSRTDEIPFLGSRAKSQPGNAIAIRDEVNRLHADIGRSRRREGEDAHDLGTRLAVLYKALADGILGYATFADLAWGAWQLTRATMYRYLRVAKYATRKQAAWGVECVLEAARVVDLLAASAKAWRKHGLARAPETIKDVEQVSFKVAGGRKVRLHGPDVTLSEVQDVLLSLGVKRPVNERRLSKERREVNAELRTLVESDPAFAGVTASWSAAKGGAVFKLVVPASADYRLINTAVADVVDRRD